jgi:hypothetical protein
MMFYRMRVLRVPFLVAAACLVFALAGWSAFNDSALATVEPAGHCTVINDSDAERHQQRDEEADTLNALSYASGDLNLHPGDAVSALGQPPQGTCARP